MCNLVSIKNIIIVIIKMTHLIAVDVTRLITVDMPSYSCTYAIL